MRNLSMNIAGNPSLPPGGRMTRRGFFHRAAAGIHGAALAYLYGRDLRGSELSAPASGAPDQLHRDLKPRAPHFEPKARAVIHLFMNGGPSQMDLFDPKPELAKRSGQPFPGKQKVETLSPSASGNLLGSPFTFRPAGHSGMLLSELLPHTARIADDIP